MLQYYRSIVYARCFFLEKEASMVIQINSQVIHYEHTYCEASSNPPLLLLHGNGEDLHIFDELIFSLRNEYEIYALDARGHGLSAAPDVLHYDDMAEDVAGFIRQLQIASPIVVGFSDGGIVALLLAMKGSTPLTGIITCGANTNPKALTLSARHQIKRTLKEKLAAKHSKNDSLSRSTDDANGTESSSTASMRFATTGALEELMLKEPDISASDLAKIQVPALILTGEHDMVKLSDSKKIAEHIPLSRLVILSGEDHGSYVVHSTKLGDYIRKFI
jgi:pimeloyl-ACP methyl ester carboxylesterase